jgi:putative PIG3 family NAD(P)H quinone oxidoreductase
MKAAVIAQFGGPDGLTVRDVPTPTPRPHEVLIRVYASALNRADVLQRLGRYPPPNDVPRDIPGLELAGIVEATGPDASRWQIGDRVFGLVGGGAHAEFAVAHEDTLARVPNAIDWPEAAAIPEAFITAHDALVMQAGLRATESVLVLAAGSGVGLAAIQIARAWGAVPFGTSRTADKIDRARAFGLEAGIALNEPDELTEAVSRWTDQRGVDVVLDLLGGGYVQPCINALALKGRMMLVGAVAGAQTMIDVRRILSKRVTLRGTVLRTRALAEKIGVTRAFAEQVVPRFESGELRPVIDSQYSLMQIADAHRRMESNETFGKVVISVRR